MNGNGKRQIRNGWSEVMVRVWVVGLAIVAGGVVWDEVAWGRRNGGQEEHVTTVRGRVLNRVTKEPIGRALVTTVGDEYAVMTDDRGQFEMKIEEQVDQGQRAGNFADSRRTVGNLIPTFSGTRAFQAKKPGFLATERPSLAAPTKDGQEEATIYLVPEALIVGRVNVPGSEGEVRVRCELYRHQTMEGIERWQPAASFTTWGSGEFRFSGLVAGTYRLITHEEMDRDSLVLGPGSQMFGYPPIYYPNTTDFSMASPIVVKAGETAHANVTLARRPYYPVRIPIKNTPVAGANLTVHPMAHWGPGWSLEYNPMGRVIEGILPDGNYTVELNTYGETASTGTANFVVSGVPLEGTPLYLVSDTSVAVNVREEFQSRHTEFGEEGIATYTTNGKQYRANATVLLTSVEEFDPMGNAASSQPVEETQGRTLTIPNVRPGRYRVKVNAFAGYVATVESGGVDLLKQPLVVGIGGAVSPIEVTLRDDGAEVSGALEEPSTSGERSEPAGENRVNRFVYLLPLDSGERPSLGYAVQQDGKFDMQQVAPGNYLLVGYDHPEENLPTGNAKALQALENTGQRIHVEAGENVGNVRVKVIVGSEGE